MMSSYIPYLEFVVPCGARVGSRMARVHVGCSLGAGGGRAAVGAPCLRDGQPFVGGFFGSCGNSLLLAENYKPNNHE